MKVSMSRLLKPAVAGLAISSLSLSFIAEIPAQTGSKSNPPQTKSGTPQTKSAPTKNQQAIRQVQAEDEEANDELEAPPAKTPQRPAAGGAKAGAGKASTAKEERPQVEGMRLEKLDPKVEQILKDWEAVTSAFKKLSGNFVRMKYDPVFQVEFKAEGEFFYEAPDKGNYEIKGVDVKALIAKGIVSKKKDKDGNPYEIKSDAAERWVCTGTEVIKIDEKEKTYEKAPIPPEGQGQNIIDGPLPFLFGMKAERAKTRYKKITLMNRTADEIQIEVLPRLPEDASNWQKAVIIIDAKLFVPKAVKLVGPSGAETVHVFSNVKVNPTKPWLGANPFKPNLWGYKLILSDKPSAASLDMPLAPTRQASGPSSKGRPSGDSPDRSSDASADSTGRKKAAAPSSRN
jgi:TIGR03009 family protein